MRIPTRSLSFLLASLGACSGADTTPSTPFSAPATEVTTPALPHNALERDLVLTLRRKSTEPFEVSRDPKFEVVLANRSHETAYPIVLSNDGSESGWREPHVWYTVERKLPSGTWEAAPTLPAARCGLYARDWEKDVQTLGPGASIVLPWFTFYQHWDMEEATHVRVVAHYAYGDHAKDLRKVPPALHAIPAYELASQPMELPIHAPVALELRLKGKLPGSAGEEALAPLVDVVAVNHSKTAQPIATADSGGSLSLEVEYTRGDGQTARAYISTSNSTSYTRDTLAAGARLSVVGAAKTHGYREIPEGATPRRVRARMALEWETPGGGSDSRVVRSPWVEVN